MPASLELVKIALQAYGNGDCEIALALADPLIRWDERASRADGDLVWGHDEVERAMRRYLDGWRQYRFELEDIAEVSPGKVVGICRERGTDANGLPVDRRFGGLWVVEAGRIASWTTFLTPKEAVRAAKELGGGRFEQRARGSEGPSAQRSPAQDAGTAGGRAPAEEIGAVAQPRPRRAVPTLSEEQKRAARARAKLRKRGSSQTA